MESGKSQQKHLLEHKLGQTQPACPTWAQTLLKTNVCPCDAPLTEFVFLGVRREGLEASKSSSGLSPPAL